MPTPVVTPRQTPARIAPQPAVYNRYDQERFIRQKEGKELVIFVINEILN